MPTQLLASAAFFVLLWAKIGSVGWEENWEIGDIFRRLFKAEFKLVTKEEFTIYLNELEPILLIRFTPEVRSELFALCTDIENGGLGIFIHLLENTLTFIRPEWIDICIAYKNNAEPYDTSQLSTVVIDKDILKQSSRFQMKK